MTKSAEVSIRVRMYRVGFGDCFLVTFPAKDGPTHVLVDCGVHFKGDTGTIQEAVQDIATETGRTLAIVIATHAHQDHISGFARFAAEFRTFRIGEVWMPWTEDRNNAIAVRLKQKHAAAIAGLERYFAELPTAAQARADGARQAIANLAASKAALDYLHAAFGTGAKVRYLQAGDALLSSGGIAGLETQILGPPIDPEFLVRMDPPPGQYYLAGNGEMGGAPRPPFAAGWALSREQPPFRLSPAELQAIHEYADESPDALAFALDRAINNTSLVALFQFGGRRLLFPGDAQYGNWEYWLQKVDSSLILSGIDFLKVAHHGSVNATPRQAIDRMGGGNLAAMVSTQTQPWPSIPREPLMAAIRKRTGNRMVRSDSVPLKPPAPNGPAIERLPPGFRRGAFWFDYYLAL